jgi:hypothetical protein
MKVAVAFAGLMASSVMADGLTRLAFYDTAFCNATNALGTDTFPASPTAHNGWTKINIDNMVFTDGGEADDYIIVHAFHYFPGTAGNNIINTAAEPYGTDTYKDTSRDDEFVVALAATPELGRELIMRIDYADSEENSCLFAKNEDTGDFQFTLNTKWNICDTFACEAAMAETTTGDVVSQSDYSIIARSSTGTTTAAEYRISEGSFPLSYNFQYTSKGGANKAFVFGLDPSADMDGVHSCVNRATDYNATQLDLPEGSTGSLLTDFVYAYSNSATETNTRSFINMNVKPDTAADDVAVPVDFLFQSRIGKMCGDSTRVAQVAVLSVASVAAGLLSFF